MVEPKKTQAVDVVEGLKQGNDFSAQEKSILLDIVDKTRFVPNENIWRSSYWGKGLGASHWAGIYENKKSVLKIQGIKPDISEIYMINEFEKQNRSEVIHPPKLYKTLPWNDKVGYEALIMEEARGDKVLKSKQIQTEGNVRQFFVYYKEYRKNCLPREAWLPRPKNIEAGESFKKLYDVSNEKFPDDSRRKSGDLELILKAAGILDKLYNGVNLQFLHGHFSVEDLIYKNRNDNKEVILFSNLFWKWRMPFYDKVFGYHWFMYELANVKNITTKDIDDQRSLWLNIIHEDVSTEEDKKLLYLALLERAAAGLAIDSFLVDKRKNVANYLTDSTREEIKRLMGELKVYA